MSEDDEDYNSSDESENEDLSSKKNVPVNKNSLAAASKLKFQTSNCKLTLEDNEDDATLVRPDANLYELEGEDEDEELGEDDTLDFEKTSTTRSKMRKQLVSKKSSKNEIGDESKFKKKKKK